MLSDAIPKRWEKKSLLSDRELTTDHCMDTTKVQFSKQMSFIAVIYRNNG